MDKVSVTQTQPHKRSHIAASVLIRFINVTIALVTRIRTHKRSRYLSGSLLTLVPAPVVAVVVVVAIVVTAMTQEKERLDMRM